MAKKKTKKRTQKEKNDLVQRILKECTAAVLTGVGTKTVGEKARTHWKTRGLRSIRKQVEKNVDWELAKKRVLPTATKMGKVAAALTGDKLRVIPIWAAKAAAIAVRKDPKCPPNAGVARGGFCP